MNTGWLSAKDALTLLNVRPQTLYASVSRKRIRVRKDPQDPRRSLYHAADVERLAARRGRHSSERVAAEAVAWGSPVLASGLSTVAHGRLWYRGVDAVELAATATLEQTAALLWQCDAVSFAGADAASPVRGLAPMQAVYQVLASRAGVDPPIYGRAAGALRVEAGGLMGAVAAAVLGAIQGRMPGRRPGWRTVPPGRRPSASALLHQRLARAWRRPGSADLIRRALVLLADHELNASTFAARVAASTGASLPACVLAGFATLSGPLHGTAAGRFALLAESAAQIGAAAAIRECLQRGESVAALGHPLYPAGDPRAQALLQVIALPTVLRDLQQAGIELIGEWPNVDFALAALAQAARLPADAPFVLFALARTAGWIAHALEQQQRGTLIRPRARYIGPALPAH